MKIDNPSDYDNLTKYHTYSLDYNSYIFNMLKEYLHLLPNKTDLFIYCQKYVYINIIKINKLACKDKWRI